MRNLHYFLLGALAVLALTNPDRASLRAELKRRKAEEYSASWGERAELLASMESGLWPPGVRLFESYIFFCIAKTETGGVLLGMGARWFRLEGPLGSFAGYEYTLSEVCAYLVGAAAAMLVCGSIPVNTARGGRLFGPNVRLHFVCGLQALREGRYHTLLTSAFHHASLSHLFGDAVSVYTCCYRFAEAMRLTGGQLLRLFALTTIFSNLAAAAYHAYRRQRWAGYAPGLCPTSMAVLSYMATKKPKYPISWMGLNVRPVHALLGQMGVEVFMLREKPFPHALVALAAALTGHLFYFALRYGAARMLPEALQNYHDFVERGDALL